MDGGQQAALDDLAAPVFAGDTVAEADRAGLGVLAGLPELAGLMPGGLSLAGLRELYRRVYDLPPGAVVELAGLADLVGLAAITGRSAGTAAR